MSTVQWMLNGMKHGIWENHLKTNSERLMRKVILKTEIREQAMTYQKMRDHISYISEKRLSKNRGGQKA